MKLIDIYTDGACSGNPGPGAWAAVLIYNGVEKEVSGFEIRTTNNRMELLAAIGALNCLKETCNVNLYSDSAYLINSFKLKWLDKWKTNGWKTASKQPVENSDLWLQLSELSDKHKITWHKVKGHSTNKYNNICDELARNLIKTNMKIGQG